MKLNHCQLHRLYCGKDPNGIPSAITILQPFVEAILQGLKRVENRKRPCFSLHDAVYKHPPTPPQTQCRFCPNAVAVDTTSNTPNTPGEGKVTKLKCTHWIHVTEENSRKRPKTPRKLAPSQSDSSDESESDDEYYSTEEEGAYQYNTRSRRKGSSDDLSTGSGRKRKRDHKEMDDYDGNHPHSSVSDRIN